MFIYISSGDGVDEVCRAVWHFYQWLEQNYSFEVLQREDKSGKNQIKSLLLQSTDERLNILQGTHLWRSQSPFRPKHKRKNWYFSVHIYEEKQAQMSIDKNEIIYQSMKSPKKGGQHVNTTCSGVRAVYKPLGLEAISYDERSQYQNKKIALFRLLQKQEALKNKSLQSAKTQRWKASKSLERGNPILTFIGEKYCLLSKPTWLKSL